MKKYNIVFAALMIVFCLGCKKSPSTKTNDNNNNPPVTTKPNNQHISMLTQHNDNTRAGLNNKETVLTTANVNAAQFGELFSLSVDDQVYAQPLVVGNLPINNGTHNVVFIATVNNTVYAYDGDDGALYWKKSFTASGMRPPIGSDFNSSWCTPYTDFTSSIGIVGTPVIDSVSKTMYFVARSTDGTTFVQYLHAINIITGADVAGSPVKLAGSVSGTGDGSVNGVVSFDPKRNNQRQGLVLVNGTVYVSFSSHCDLNPYHGWILGYNASTLQQQTIYVDTPNGENGGLWESGMGIAADAQGNLYEVSGNGTVGTAAPYSEIGNGTAEGVSSTNPADLTNRGESAMKLTPSGGTLQVSSFFTPSNYLDLNINDLDYGVMGTFLVPNTNYYFTGAKDGNLYLLNKDNMGGYSYSGNQVIQTIPLNNGLHCQPAYYNGGTNEYIYVWANGDQLRQLPFNRAAGTLGSSQTLGGGGPQYPGADMSVSSNGTLPGTGILWASYGVSGISNLLSGVLVAFDANNVTKQLWNSNQNVADGVGYYAKFSSPTVADGHVYLATFSNSVNVYGLK
jgi:hypothetical protein